MENSTTSRRALLKAAPIAAVAVAIPANAAIPPTVDATEWDNALNAYRTVERNYDLLCDQLGQAEEAAARASHPRIDRYFDDYRLGIGMKREDIVFWLGQYNRNAAEKIDVQRTADEFEAYQQDTLDARARFRTAELDEERRAYFPTYQATRDALMQVPAPHDAALLVKMEIAAMSKSDRHLELALADAHRLRGGRA